MTTTTDRLAAAQTARAAAKRAFNSAVNAAVDAAVARGIRDAAAIDAAVEADPRVIAARVASASAVAELADAEKAATASERLELVEHGARVAAAAMTEHVATVGGDDHSEDSCVTSSTTPAPVARPVFAVRLDSITGNVCEGFDRLDGTATTREEAIEAARAAGLAPVIRGGNIELTPGEVVGEEHDVWTVTVDDGSEQPEVALHNDPERTTLVSEMTDDEIALCHRNAPLMDEALRERINGTADDDRAWLSLYAVAHLAKHGEVWTLP